MKCRTRELPSDPVPGSESAKARRLRTSSTQHGGKNSEASAETETGLEQVLEASNMQRAWQRVRRNRGAPGIDGMTIDEFPAFAREHWERISSQIEEGTYNPAPVRRIHIPKPDGSQRPLGVPTVLDRVIQQAIAQVLTPLYDGEFSDQSYGFREGRNAHQAVRRVQGGWELNRCHAIDCDLKAFFDMVNHERARRIP